MEKVNGVSVVKVTAPERRVGPEEPKRSRDDVVIGRMHSKPVRTSEGLLDYGEWPSGGRATSHGADGRQLGELGGMGGGAPAGASGGDADPPAETSPTGIKEVDEKLNPTPDPVAPPPPTPPGPLQCTQASDEHLIQIIYYVPRDWNPQPSKLPTIAENVKYTAQFLADEARLTDRFVDPPGLPAQRTLKLQTDADCEPLVAQVNGTVAIGSDPNQWFGLVTADLANNFRYNDPRRKYLVFVEGSESSPYGGEGTIYRDSRKSRELNSSNTQPGYALIYEPFWASDRAPLHEIGHNLSAVQPGAPDNNTPAGSTKTFWHCWDEQDVMCYADGGIPPVTVCADKEYFDCNRNDYFNPASFCNCWLDSNFNMANDSMLITHGDWTPPRLSEIQIKDKTPIDGTEVVPASSDGYTPTPPKYSVKLGVSGSDNWTLSLRIQRSGRVPWDATGKCPADSGTNYAIKYDVDFVPWSGPRTSSYLKTASFGIARGGCYRFYVTARDPHGNNATVSRRIKVGTPTDHALEPVKDATFPVHDQLPPAVRDRVPWWRNSD